MYFETRLLVVNLATSPNDIKYIFLPNEKKMSFHLQGFCDCFNIDTKTHRIIKGPKQAQFGYTVQQHVGAGGEKW